MVLFLNQVFFIIFRDLLVIKINLPVLLAQRGIKVADLDRQIDVSRSTLYRMYNNDVIKVDLDALDKLCKLLDCNPGDIILYEDDDQTNAVEKEPTK